MGDDELEPLVADLHRATKTYTLAPYDDVPDVLIELRRRGLVLAVCSNWDWDLERAVASVGLDGLVDAIVTSAQAGARKPHPRIFEHTLDRCGLAPAETLFVGDTWGPDVEGPGPRACGRSISTAPTRPSGPGRSGPRPSPPRSPTASSGPPISAASSPSFDELVTAVAGRGRRVSRGGT